MYITLRSSANKDLYPENTRYDFTNQLCTTVNFKNRTSVAVAEIHLPLNYKGLRPQQNFNTLLMFSDIVDDSIIGSARLNILKLVTVGQYKTYLDAETRTYQNLFYLPVTRNSLNNIRIRFEDNLGNILKEPLITFLRDTDETFIVLHFK
jgi:hypothetical protein